MRSPHEDYISELYIDAIEDLITHYTSVKPVIVPEDTVIPGEQLATVIGFGESRLSGSSALVAEPSVAQALSAGSVADPLDWLGELNNQVVGRLKNKLVRRGLSVQLSTPIVATGSRFGFSSLRACSSRWAIRWEGGMMLAFLALNVAPDLILAPVEQDDVAEEGSMFLF